MEEGGLRTWWKDGELCGLNQLVVRHMRIHNSIPWLK